MTEWATIKNPGTKWLQVKDPAADPKVPAATVSEKAWNRVYKPMGWKLVKGDDK